MSSVSTAPLGEAGRQRWSMCRKKQLFLDPLALNLALHLFTLKIFLASV
jgi:hypothetical protein